MNFRLILAGTSLALTLTTAAAAQQPWLQDRRYGEGIGLRAGNLEFHPGVAAEFGYDSNYFQRAEGEVGGVEDAWRLRVTPSLTISTLTQRRLGAGNVAASPMFTMSARLFAAYNELFGSEEVSDQRHVDAGVGARFDIAPQRQFGADLYGDFLRQGEPSNLADTATAFDRGTVRGGAGVSWRPGGGLFDWRLGYEAAYNYFEDTDFESLDNVQHSILTKGRWRFLPRTALLYDAQYTLVRYQDSGSGQPNGDFVQARVGFSGLITAQLAFLALVGWNSSFYEAGAAGEPGASTVVRNYDGYVAHGELKYFLMPPATGESAQVGISSIAAGYVRSFSNSYLGSFLVSDRGYLNLSYFLGGVFVASLEGGFSHVWYPDSLSNDSFEQSRIDARLFGEYRLSDIFGINTTLLYDQAIGGDDYTVDPGPPRVADNLEYKRFQAYLGMRVFW